MVIRSRTPTRIDFAGGTTDLAAFASVEGGAVINAAVNRYAYCTYTPSAQAGVRIVSQDLEEFVEAADIRDLEYDGNLDLLKAAVRQMNLEGGMQISVRCEAPPGSGTGSSASVGVALLGLLDYLRAFDQGHEHSKLSRFEIADMACDLEHELGIVGGKQDQYAAACGGLSYMTFEDPEVTVEPLTPSRDFILELEKSLLLVYTGKSRLSGDIISTVMDAYLRNETAMTEPLMNLRDAGHQMRDAIVAEDLVRVGEVLDRNWENQKRLYESMTTPKIEALMAMARGEGVLGGKACGAGGGGCIVLLCEPDREHLVRRSVEDLGGHIIDFSFDYDGLTVWQSVKGRNGESS